MIVIAVIGILITIGLISWNGAQSRARKNSANASGEQTKLKLAERFVSQRRYPQSKTSVVSYLNSEGSTTLATEIARSEYTYAATSTSGGACNETGGTPCGTYTLTINRTRWNGSTTDTNIVIRP